MQIFKPSTRLSSSLHMSHFHRTISSSVHYWQISKTWLSLEGESSQLLQAGINCRLQQLLEATNWQLQSRVTGNRQSVMAFPSGGPSTLHSVALASYTQALVHWHLTVQHLLRDPAALPHISSIVDEGSCVCREHGLFPPGDSLLMQLASEAGTYAFEKHLAGESSPYELLKNGSWTSGDEAAQAGFDLRLFYKANPLCYLTRPACDDIHDGTVQHAPLQSIAWT